MMKNYRKSWISERVHQCKKTALTSKQCVLLLSSTKNWACVNCSLKPYSTYDIFLFNLIEIKYCKTLLQYCFKLPCDSYTTKHQHSHGRPLTNITFITLQHQRVCSPQLSHLVYFFEISSLDSFDMNTCLCVNEDCIKCKSDRIVAHSFTMVYPALTHQQKELSTTLLVLHHQRGTNVKSQHAACSHSWGAKYRCFCTSLHFSSRCRRYPLASGWDTGDFNTPPM